MSRRSIPVYVRPPLQRFTQERQATLESTLQQIDASTRISFVDQVSELQLTMAGKTSDGYRFTRGAFTQIAKLLAPGLGKLLPDITGTVPLPTNRADLLHSAAAIRLWNELVESRFRLVEGQRLIRNTTNNTIEGLIGQTHQHLGNYELYREVGRTFSEYPQHSTLQFYTAILVGRRISLWFRHSEPVFVVRVAGERWPFYTGFQFMNGEATGTAVRGMSVIFCKAGVCLCPDSRSKASHVGRDFLGRFHRMLTVLAELQQPIALAMAGAAQLETSLGYTVDMTDRERKLRTSDLARRVTNAGVPGVTARTIVEAGLNSGRYHGQPDTPQLQHTGRMCASRTRLDLLIPVLATARAMELSRRERLEQVGYEILTGQFFG